MWNRKDVAGNVAISIGSLGTSAGRGAYTATAMAGSVKDTAGKALAAGKFSSFALRQKWLASRARD